MQTILGAGGSIGTELAKYLPAHSDAIRLVSRHPRRVNATDELLPADLTSADQTARAVEGSAIVYLTVGLEYKASVWEEAWPRIMDNVIAACQAHDAKLVFFDNIYMYDRDHLDHMTEETPLRPTSKKGTVRARIADRLLKEVSKGRLTALIARAPDFLGPANSVPVELVYKNFAKGKKADWFADVGKVHSLIYVADAARGTALLGNTPDAFNQVWHLPTDPSRLTGRDWIGLFAETMEAAPRYRVLPTWMMGALGLFLPIMRELKEMAYQYDRDYFFDSSKFNRRFQYTPLPPREAVQATVAALRD